MSCTCAPALIHLRNQFNEQYPNRDKASDGCCGDASHAARKSDHNPKGGYAHAYDFDEDIAAHLGSAPLTRFIKVLLMDSRSKYIIYERRIYYAQCSVHGPHCYESGGHPYNGINAHEHHLHLSIKDTATFDTRDWIIFQPSTPKELFTVGQYEDIMARLQEIEKEQKRQGEKQEHMGHDNYRLKLRTGLPDSEPAGEKIVSIVDEIVGKLQK